MSWIKQTVTEIDQLGIQARVARGVALLDTHHPNWHNTINLATLDLFSCTRCVLGQLFGHFDTGYKKLDIFREKSNVGFYGWSSYDELADLEAEWVRVITVRREATATEAATRECPKCGGVFAVDARGMFETHEMAYDGQPCRTEAGAR